MQTCPSCGRDWPDDRFNGVHPECFKCRASTLSVGFGTLGREFFHNTTVLEYTTNQYKEAKRNGMDIVPAHTASVAVAGSAIKKLEAKGA